jgi:hypothetical protein
MSSSESGLCREILSHRGWGARRKEKEGDEGERKRRDTDRVTTSGKERRL